MKPSYPRVLRGAVISADGLRATSVFTEGL
jgi:hypothetical protein